MEWREGIASEAGRTLVKVTFDWGVSRVEEARSFSAMVIIERGDGGLGWSGGHEDGKDISPLV